MSSLASLKGLQPRLSMTVLLQFAPASVSSFIWPVNGVIIRIR